MNQEMIEKLLKHKCRYCNGFGYTAEHADTPHHNGDCDGSCPIQVQCEDCHGEGYYVTLDTLRLATIPSPKIDLQQWVSVEDRLPEEDEDVLLFDDWQPIGGGDRRKDVRVGYLHASTTIKTKTGKAVSCEWKGSADFCAFNITHWQPLPQPPTDLEPKKIEG